MTCIERRDAIFLFAADQLDGAERDELRAHLATDCPRCLGSLAAAQATLANLALALEPIEPPTSLRERLRARVLADAPARHAPARSDWRRPALAAGIAALVAFGLGRLTTRPELDRLQGETAANRAALEVLASPNVSELDLSGQALGFRGWARMYYDQGTRDCYLRAAVVNRPADGESYVLWFTSADGVPTRGGVLELDENGEAVLLTEMPPGVDVSAPVYVTPERDPTVEAPTTKPLLVGLMDSI